MKRIAKRALCILLALPLLFCLFACRREKTDGLRVAVLDAGQGDCILISQGENHLLIDSGAAAERDAVLSELTARGVKDLNAFVVTHPHEDHYGNARAVLETRTVSRLILSDIPSDELGYRLMTEAAARCEIPISTVRDETYAFMLGDAVCEVFCPLPEASDANNAGLVVRVTFGACALLFMGDAEGEAEAALLPLLGERAHCDLLKVGHHGSRAGTTAEFLQATAPTVAAISCGEDNDYGFPHREALERLEEVGARVYRTDLSGTLDFVCDGETVAFTGKEP